jgi:hypothetical protein
VKSFCRYTLSLLAAYTVAWTAASVFILVSRGDSLEVNSWFYFLKLAWTFRGGELPTFIWLVSVVMFVPLASLAVIILKRDQRRNRIIASLPDPAHKS